VADRILGLVPKSTEDWGISRCDGTLEELALGAAETMMLRPAITQASRKRAAAGVMAAQAGTSTWERDPPPPKVCLGLRRQ